MIKLFIPDRLLCYTEVKFTREHFPDNTLLLKTGNHILKDVKIVWYYEDDAELFTIICLAKKAKGRKELIMPYCPNARQDRVKSNEDVFTLKYFAETINSLGFDEVCILDPHSSVSEALFDNVHILTPEKYIHGAIERINSANLVLYFPDAGACKRYSDMFPEYKYIYGNKIREWETGKIIGTEIVNPFNIDLKEKDVLMVDDICSKGTTFSKASEVLNNYDVNNIYLYVTHCEDTILKGEVLTNGLIEKVFTTNSIYTKNHEKISVISIY